MTHRNIVNFWNENKHKQNSPWSYIACAEDQLFPAISSCNFVWVRWRIEQFFRTFKSRSMWRATWSIRIKLFHPTIYNPICYSLCMVLGNFSLRSYSGNCSFVVTISETIVSILTSQTKSQFDLTEAWLVNCWILKQSKENYILINRTIHIW